MNPNSINYNPNATVENGSCSEITIGKTYQGGIIAYILQPGDSGYDAKIPHGLIAAPTDQSEGITWNNGKDTITGATETAFGKGLSNTNKILAAQDTGNYAARICDSLVLGGYSDWYLPSMLEMDKFYLNLKKNAAFTKDIYWSSSERSASTAYGHNVYIGYFSEFRKNTLARVRAVRKF